MNPSSSGYMPEALLAAIKGEIVTGGGSRGRYSFQVEYRVEHGVALEARVRSREVLHVVALSS